MKILTVVGARPQFVKAATISRAIAKREGVSEFMVHTGQHFDHAMSAVFFSELGIPEPAANLGIQARHHGEMTARMLTGIEAILLEEKPDFMLVYGDTNSTLAGALAAVKLHIPIAHVEAGLRSFNRAMPEEINRLMTDHLSARLYCPTSTAVTNLRNEGITEGVYHVGDVMYDATLDATKRALQESSIIEKLDLDGQAFSLATVHRAENTSSAELLAEVLAFLKHEATQRTLVMPLHPRTRQAAEQFGLDFDGIKLIEPVGYLDMTRLLHGCVEVFTDSGGVQKEAYFHRKLCTTLRPETEWTETVTAGWNRLWRGDARKPQNDIDEYGRGDTAELILNNLLA